MNRKQFISILIPTIILLAMTVVPLKTILYGTEILLETRPVDPRDLFRGDYVILSLKIEEIDIEKVDETLRRKLIEYSLPYNKELYVVIKEANGVYEADRVTEVKPANKELYLKAKFMYGVFNDPSGNPKISVSYNIDKYFVPENTGGTLEEMARNGELFVKAKVSSGYVTITDVIQKD